MILLLNAISGVGWRYIKYSFVSIFLFAILYWTSNIIDNRFNLENKRSIDPWDAFLYSLFTQTTIGYTYTDGSMYLKIVNVIQASSVIFLAALSI